MKRFNIFVFALLIAFGCFAFALPDFFDAANAEETATPITNVREFKNIFNDEASAAKEYYLKNDIDFDGETIDTSDVSFSGVLDGKGWTIKNFVLTSSTSNFGLFSSVKGSSSKKAVIKNLKLESDKDGKFLFDIPSSNSEIYAGVMIGWGENVCIENCEIQGQPVEDTEKNAVVCVKDQNEFSSNTKFTFGGFAGAILDGSSAKNCITYLDGNFHCSWQSTELAKGPIKIGGFAGLVENSKLQNIASFSNFEGQSDSQNTEIFFGGIAGEMQNDCTLLNSIFAGTLNKNNSNIFVGGLIGTMFSSAPQSRQIDSNYWVGSFDAIGKNNSTLTLNDKNARRQINYSFLSNKSNWNDSTDGWKFDSVWDWPTGKRLHLQEFMTFEFTFASDVDGDDLDVIGTKKINGVEGDKYQSKFDEDITIDLTFNVQNKGYYQLKDIWLNGYSFDKNLTTIVKSDDGYQISFKASKVFEGEYSFEFSALPFTYFVGVDYLQDNQTEDLEEACCVRVTDSQGSPDRSLTKKDNTKDLEQSIDAVEGGIFTFDHWELWTWNAEKQDYVLKNGTLSSEQTFKFKFGDKDLGLDSFVDGVGFKLVAFFTDKDALYVSFSGFNNNIVTQIKFNGKEYDGEPIKISQNADNVELSIVVKENYQLNTDELIAFLSKSYGDKDTTLLRNFSELENEDGSTTYTFKSLNMKSIKSGLGNEKEFKIQVHSSIKVVDNKNDLTWLWITLGVVGGVVLIGGVILFVLLRRRKIFKRMSEQSGTVNTRNEKVKKTKEKKVNYRDYYG